MTWNEALKAAKVEKARSDRKRDQHVQNDANDEIQRKTPTRQALEMRIEFQEAVAQFVSRMPRSASEKDGAKRGTRPGKRYFYLRDSEAESQNRDVRYIGAHVYHNGRVVTYGMGLERDVDANIDAKAMNHVMKLMARELVKRDLI